MIVLCSGCGRGTEACWCDDENHEVAGIDYPLANGCWRCIGCGKILKRDRGWNQCSECDTRDPQDVF